ncbi:Dynamin-1 [Halotydeus destructor]|nr:Dynamin-1 [Halotydeus destructor]
MAPSAVRNDGMEQLVSVVNELQDIFGRLENKQLALSLPQIAVVGGQSSGKSSVLESIVGRDFLPRGSGIVTRCPLILQMSNREGEEYWIFQHLPTKKFVKPDEVRYEIQRKTTEMAGSSKGVTDTPITLKFYSPKVLDLTLVDLPGLTRIAIAGQPADIADQIRSLVMAHIKNENVLILAITQANQDLATSDAINIAGEADPSFDRTIGVLTKLDIVEPEHERSVRDVLDNKVFNLKYGFIGVINRAQKDIDDGRDIDFAYAKEKDMFSKKKWFKPIMNRLGTKFLQQVLNKQLAEHIALSMPKIKALIEQWHTDSRLKLAAYGDLEEDEASMMTKLVTLVDYLKQNMAKSIGGANGEDADSGKISTGFELREKLGKYRDVLFNMVFDEKTVKRELYLKMQNMQGLESAIFPPDKAIIGITKSYIDKLIEPIKDAICDIEATMEVLIKELVETFNGYPKLKVAALRILRRQLKTCVATTNQRVSEFCDQDKVYIDTEAEELQLSFKKLNHESSSLFVASAGTYQELCTGVLEGSDKNLYNCKLTAAKLVFQQQSPAKGVLYPEFDVSINDYKIDSSLNQTVRLHFNQRVGGIDQLRSTNEVMSDDTAWAWCAQLRDIFKKKSDREKKVTKEALTEPPAHLRNSINAMYAIFLCLMEISKKKYSEHVRKMICFNTIACFQQYVDTQKFFGQLLKEQNDVTKLMARSPEAKAMIENLKEEVEACAQALEVIDNMVVL